MAPSLHKGNPRKGYDIWSFVYQDSLLAGARTGMTFPVFGWVISIKRRSDHLFDVPLHFCIENKDRSGQSLEAAALIH